MKRHLLNGRSHHTCASLPAIMEHIIATVGIVTVMSACGGGADSTTVAQPVDHSVASVTISPTTATIPAGQQKLLVATPRDGTGNAVNGLAIAWISNAPGVATVDAAGNVTGVAGGNALVTASVSGKSAFAVITVLPPTYDGRWNGTTALGDSVAFTIAGAAVTDALFKFRLTGECPVGALTIRVTGPSGAVSGQQLTIMSGGADLNVSGTLLSFTDASGTGSLTYRGASPTCTSTGATTWTAHKS